MKFRKNAEGLIILKDREGDDVGFRFPIDAREALSKVDEDGEARYTCPPSSVVGFKEELAEINERKNRDKRQYMEKAVNKGIKTTLGKEISPEYLVPEENIGAGQRVSIDENPRETDNKAVEDMGFEDEENEPLTVEDKPKKKPGRKPAVKEEK
jgi:hypothetical protein